jgi:hypothetical protein
MRTLKLLVSSAAAALFLTATASAQQFQPITLLSSHTNAPSALSNYTAVVNVRAATVVGIMTESTLSGSGSDEIVWTFAKSVDGANFETTPSLTITNTSNGSTTVRTFTALDVTGVHTLKLLSVTNGSSSRMLTNAVYVGVKNFLR